MGDPNATSSQGQPAMKRPAMNTSTEGSDSVEVQQQEQRVSAPNVGGEIGSELVGPSKGALSDILNNEEAFQNHLTEIDMELEGYVHKDKGVYENGADAAEVSLMLKESHVADFSIGVLASSVHPSMDGTKAGSQLKQVDGCQAIQSDLVVHDQNETGTVSGDLNHSSVGPGSNTRTWKRLQVQAKVGNTFVNARVAHISTVESDHCMLCLHWGRDTRNRKRTGKLFRFEAMWLCDPRCPEVVSEAWERGLSFSSGSPIHNCLHSCREALERWNKVEFGHVGRRISALQTNLQRLEQQPELYAF
nr:hypothetical protein CFP56_67942 [Quercus suber]